MIWYKETVENLYKLLDTSDNGISKNESSKRLKQYGPNRLKFKRQSVWLLIIEPFKSVFVAVLGLAALVSLISHEMLDAIIIVAIIIINACIFYTQQYTTTRVLRNLNRQTIGKTTVIRDGIQAVVSVIDIVPGDILVLSEGEKIPADARVIHSDNLQMDESILTGESVPVQKYNSTLESDKEIYEQDNMVFQGTYVLSGESVALVVETGERTEFGKIVGLAKDDTKSPVQAKIDDVIKLIVKAVALLAVVVFILSLARGISADEALRFVLALSVSAVPEGLPIALTVIIVLGMRRMAKKKALVRSFKAIEDVGLVTTIATDKTGTLTKNHLEVIDMWSLGDQNVKKIALKAMNLQSGMSDPIDKAIGEMGDNKSQPHMDKYYPFDQSIRMSGAYYKKDGLIYLMGSPEHILSLSAVNKEDRRKSESAMHEFTASGYRVVSIAEYSVGQLPPDDLGDIDSKKVQFVGFLAFADELRPEAAGAIKLAQQAGISVRLITGDHFETAYNIGHKIGLANHINQVIQGTELPKNQAALAESIQSKSIFARILPEDKFRILKALKETEITAMTGDGVNDVPALTNAHVGFAMGSGSDIARDAGGIVLMDDNFKTIVAAIAEGRKIYDNIKRMLFYLLSTALGEVLTMIGALLFGLPLPVTAVQILWINLVTDTAMVLPLGLEPEEDNLMNRPPRKPKEPLLGKIIFSRITLVALMMAASTLVIVTILKNIGYSTAQIQTVAFMNLIVVQWMNAFNARSENKSSFSRIKRVNKGLIVGLVVAFALQILVMFGPLQSVFGIQKVPIFVLALCSGLSAILVLFVSEMHKLIIKKLYIK